MMKFRELESFRKEIYRFKVRYVVFRTRLCTMCGLWGSLQESKCSDGDDGKIRSEGD